jgi:hypothetical protein
MENNDVKLTKQTRNMFGKHDIDISMADVRVSYGVCTVSGKLQKLPKTKVEKVEVRVQQIASYIRQLPGIREVVLHCEYKEEI